MNLFKDVYKTIADLRSYTDDMETDPTNLNELITALYNQVKKLEKPVNEEVSKQRREWEAEQHKKAISNVVVSIEDKCSQSRRIP